MLRLLRPRRKLALGLGSLELTASVVPGMVPLKHLEAIGNCSAEIGHYAKALQFIKDKRQKYPNSLYRPETRKLAIGFGRP